MKRTFLLKTLLLLCALVAGSSSVWADDETITLNFETGSIPSGWTATRFAVCDNPLSSTSTTNGSYACTTDGTSQNHILRYNSLIKNVKSISVDACKTSNNSNGTVQIEFSTDGETWGSTQSVTVSKNSWANSKLTLTSATDGYVRITFSGTTAIKYIDNIVITYTPAAKTDPTITFNNGSVNAGKTLDLSTLFTSNSSGAVTYSITEGSSYASIDGAIFTGVAEGSVTVKASQDATLLYNAGEKTATITVNAAPALSSIAITTAPTKTTYKEGQTFDPTGMVVTATYADESTDDVTALCTFTPDGTLSTSDTKVTVSYTENEVTKTADQAITVTAQSTDITINTNYEWLGVDNGSNIAAEDLPKAIDCDGLTVTLGTGGTNKPRGDATYIRLYAKNSLKFTAPANHFIKSIVFTVYNSNWTNSFNVSGGGSWNNSTKTWSCGDDFVTEVTLTEAGTSGNNQFSQMEIKLVASKDITITAAKWASFSSSHALDFTGTDVTAYIAKAKDDSNVTLTEIKKVPANTGIVVNAAAAGTFAIPVLSGDADDTTGNLLKAWLNSGTPTETKYYTLAVDGDGKPVFKKSSGGTLAGGKSYLVVSGSPAPSIGVDFGETTGITNTNLSNLTNETGEVYNLNGQRVAQPTKGLYIVNGKKVIIK